MKREAEWIEGRLFRLISLILFLQPLMLASAVEVPPVSEMAVPFFEDADVEVDGHLSDPIWQDVPRFSGFVDIRGEGLVEHQTSAAVFVTNHDLCFAFLFDEPDTGSLKADAKEHDSQVWLDDSIEVFVQRSPSDDYYHLLLNSVNTVLDEKGRDATYEIQGKTGVYISDTFWTAEICIPLSEIGWTLNPGDEFRLSLMRNQFEDGLIISSAWSVLRAIGHDPERFGIARVREARSVAPWKMSDVHPLIPAKNQFTVTAPAAKELKLTLRDWDGSVLLEQSLNKPNQDVQWDGQEYQSISVSMSNSADEVLYRAWWPFHGADWNRLLDVARRAREAEELLREFRETASPEFEIKLEELQKRASAFAAKLQSPELLEWGEYQNLLNESHSFGEELDNVIQEASIRKHYPDGSFAVGACSSMEKVMIRDHVFPGRFDKQWRVQLAQGEREAFQLAILPLAESLKGIRVEPQEFLSDGGTVFPSENIEVSLVGHVKTGQPSYSVPYIGWWPDPLLSFQKRADGKPGETIAFWIEFHADQSVVSGEYQGKIKVTAEDRESVEVAVDLTVWDFALNRPFHLPTAFTFDQTGPKKIHGSDWNEDILETYWQALIQNGIDVDQIYRSTLPSMEEIQYHVNHETRNFNLVYIDRQHLDQKSLTFDKEEQERILSILDDLLPKLEARGWDDKAYLYSFDELHKEFVPAAKEIFAQIRAKYPDLRIMTTAYDYSWGKETGLYDLVDIWVPLTPYFDREDALELRAAGKDMWWYICIEPKDPYANWFIEDSAIQARLLTGALSARYQPGGFLYYHTDLWQENDEPIRRGPHTNWDPASYLNNNGDGSLLCAGINGAVQTIRLKNIRDGFEDFEYHHVLKTLYEESRDNLEPDERKQIEELLDVPDTVVRDRVNFTHYPEDVLKWRQQMARSILRLKSDLPPLTDASF